MSAHKDTRDTIWIDDEGKEQVEGGDWWYEGEPCFARLLDPNLHHLKCSGWQSHTGFCSPCGMAWRAELLAATPEGYTPQYWISMLHEYLQEMNDHIPGEP